ncbi:MAG: hypothetical protein JWM04_2791 [Verrucomicrobiales bacterium]|nr:hypothetical protein [Verrucomicrobiales bacterium]
MVRSLQARERIHFNIYNWMSVLQLDNLAEARFGILSHGFRARVVRDQNAG